MGENCHHGRARKPRRGFGRRSRHRSSGSCEAQGLCREHLQRKVAKVLPGMQAAFRISASQGSLHARLGFVVDPDGRHAR
jgi:hypothetical protein